MHYWQRLNIISVADDVFAHALEDTIKNLKHGSDSLASILCDYKDCNIETVKKIVVLTGHIIKDRLTIIKYSPGDSCKWAAVETRSCTVPLTYERRRESIKLFEAFAYIYVSKTTTYTIHSKCDLYLTFISVDIERAGKGVWWIGRRKVRFKNCQWARYDSK